jgi:nucleoside-diphosphate-sugar epimerase
MKVLITGGAGYIGSVLSGALLYRGYKVDVVDDLLFGADAIMPYMIHPNFTFHKANVCEKDRIRPIVEDKDFVIHLAAIVGFPACQQVGEEVAWLYNFEATKNVLEMAEASGVKRFIFASTYSNYGISEDDLPVTEQSPLNPQSLYAQTKIASEEYVLDRGRDSNCCDIIFRFATLFGLSPRTRFDLIINQFVLEAISKRKLVIYQKNYNRSFVHVRDAVKAIITGLEAGESKVRNQVFNVGSNNGNYTKEAIIHLIQKYVPAVTIEYKDLTFGGDMRDIKVSFDKIERQLGYKAEVSVEEGIRELCEALLSGYLYEPHSGKHRNAQFIVQ